MNDLCMLTQRSRQIRFYGVSGPKKPKNRKVGPLQ